MSMILGSVLGIALAILLYAMVSRGDQSYYKRRQEIIEQRLARLQEAEQELNENEKK